MVSLSKNFVSTLVFALVAGCSSAQPAAQSPAEVDGQPQKSAVALPAPPVAEADASLLPREVIYGNPERTAPKISPDGKHLAWTAPRDGVLNVYVAPVGQLDQAQPVTNERGRPVPFFVWAYDSQHVLYALDENGDENVHVFSVDVKTQKRTDLTPYEKTQGRIGRLSDRFPGQAVLEMNDRDPKYHDVYRVDLKTGKRTLLQKNERFAAFDIDDSFAVRFGLAPKPGGSYDILRKKGKGFEPFQTIPADDIITTSTIGFDKSGRTLYIQDSRGRNTSALTAFDTVTNETKLLAEDPRADSDHTLRSPKTGRVEAVSFEYDRRKWKVLDPAVEGDFAYLKTVVDGDFYVVSRNQEDTLWTLAYVVSDGPVRFYSYDRAQKKAQFLFTNRSKLEKWKLAKMHPQVLTSRDGKQLVSYLSLPVGSDEGTPGKPQAPLPMVLLVHGGPWGRDGYGLNPMHQWLTSRGYAVLSVNYRGSTGFGKEFVNAGDKEWAGKMHDDLLDAVAWATGEGIADPDRVAIMGGSYGGYATLVGLTFTPEVFACGVDIVGPSNLQTLLSSIPPYWAPMLELFARRVGDPRTEEGKALLAERSPLTRADAIVRPLLIGQGANDPRVKQAESDQIVGALTSKELPVTYALFPDEGHGFARPENRLAFFAVAEAFLAKHLGGKYEPIGDDLTGSSLQVPHGASHIEGLEGALQQVGTAAP